MQKGYLYFSLFFMLTLFFCGGTKVARIDQKSITDLSGKWNDTDSRLVTEEMVSDCLSKPWLSNFNNKNNQPPTIIIGQIYNKTHEHISEETFIKDIETYFVNSGLVNIVEGGVVREQIREERADQQQFANEQTKKNWNEEIGADFMMTGSINSIVDQSGRTKVVFYQVDLELINIETNMKAWIGSKKIKKLIEGNSYKF